ncbi:hypothetical protein BWQ96_03773 [Gracilariopsis chorda]|uniref:Uncharacterized protein n=1 Tax=Gracilariopsis chorda TaxID=448386 RepID=A0A2V3IWD5_9FLOR|nr:hypothetical protein BWQ96_03773 [Gracilariopsis chorda]|eukprot:PXF46448.1 hypothetical protein BWQ96_03773 [Gracilariopsis chorda]
MDIGCPRNVGRVQSPARLASALGIPFKLRELDRDPFFHGYGTEYSYAHLLFAMWDLPVVDILGNEASIPFYIIDGDGLLLLGNEFVHRGNLLGQESLLTIPPVVAGKVGLALQTYNSRLPGDSEDSIRTRLLVIPSTIHTIKSYFVSFRGLYA